MSTCLMAEEALEKIFISDVQKETFDLEDAEVSEDGDGEEHSPERDSSSSDEETTQSWGADFQSKM